MKFLNRKIEMAVIAIFSIVFVIWSAAFIYKSSFIAVDGNRYFCLFDDAMISMRYAWNFSHGLGLVWNSGEYVQGYTNLLMTLWMSFATLIFDKSVAALFIQISGAVFMLIIAFVSMRIADFIVQEADPNQRTLVRILSFLFALSYFPLAFWSLMGMETGLLTLLILLGVLSALKYTTSMKSKYLLSVAGYLGLAYLTRNDTLIFAFLILLYILFEIYLTSTNRKNFYQLLFFSIGLYFFFVIGQFVFQYLYYGELLPNTYTLKLTGMSLSARITNGIGFVTPFIKEIVLVLTLAIIGLVIEFKKQKLLLFSLVLSALGYQVYVGGDPWNYWRIMSPSMPLLFILFLSSIYAAIRSISNNRAVNNVFLHTPAISSKFISGVLLVLLCLIGLWSANLRFLNEISLSIRPYQSDSNQANVNTAIAINQVTERDASIGVFWAGSIPYFSDRKAIDFLGKSDKYVATLPPDISGVIGWNGMFSVPGHNKYDLNYSIKTLEPTYVQRLIWGKQDLTQWAKAKYISVDVFDGVTLFLLKDSPEVQWSKVNVP